MRAGGDENLVFFFTQGLIFCEAPLKGDNVKMTLEELAMVGWLKAGQHVSWWVGGWAWREWAEAPRICGTLCQKLASTPTSVSCIYGCGFQHSILYVTAALCFIL